MKYLLKFSNKYCAEKDRTSNTVLVVATVVGAMALPASISAEVANFVFITGPQVVQPGVVSEQITVQAQSAGGESSSLTSTACFSFVSTSAQGEFSSNATNWSPVSVLTMNKGTANKNFYYKDTQNGTQTLTIKIALKPESESRSCASWPVEEWNMQWTVTQGITVGASSPSGSSGSSDGSQAGTTPTGAEDFGPGNKPVGSSKMPPPPKVFADGGGDRTVIVGADTEFRARAYDEKKHLIDFATFHWNFGDGSTAETSVVYHHFDHPGRYVVVLEVPEEKDSASDQFTVTVERMELGLSLFPDGSVAIENHAGRTLDLSRWAIRSLGRTFTIPDRTFVLTRNTLYISQDTLGFTSGPDVELDYPNGVFALGLAPVATSSLPVRVTTTTPEDAAEDRDEEITQDLASEAVPAEIDSGKTEPPELPATSPSSEQVAAAATSPSESSFMWWFGALGIAGLAAGSLTLARRYGKKEWDIIEESDEAV